MKMQKSGSQQMVPFQQKHQNCIQEVYQLEQMRKFERVRLNKGFNPAVQVTVFISLNTSQHEIWIPICHSSSFKNKQQN